MTTPDELERVRERFAGTNDRDLARQFIRAEQELASWRSKKPKQKDEAHQRVDEFAASAAAALTEKIGELRYWSATRELLPADFAGIADLMAATDPEILQRLHDAIAAPVPSGQADAFGSLEGWEAKRDMLFDQCADLALERDRRVLSRSEAATKESREAVEAKFAS